MKQSVLTTIIVLTLITVTGLFVYIKVNVSPIMYSPNIDGILPAKRATDKVKHLNITKEEEKVWDDLHKNQTKNAGFIHLYQQMITAGPYGGARHQEIIDSIQYNIDHIYVKYLYMLEETGRERQMYKDKIFDPLHKVRFIPFGQQPNYSDVFETIMKHMYPNVRKNELWMLANADIVLGEGFDMVKGNLDNKTILALSRHVRFCTDVNKCFFSEGGSTDCFVGIAEVKQSVYKKFNFFHYARGGENIIMWHLRQAGFTVINPCYDIKTYHNHCSKDRSWGKGTFGWTRVDTPQTRGFAYSQKWPYKKNIQPAVS